MSRHRDCEKMPMPVEIQTRHIPPEFQLSGDRWHLQDITPFFFLKTPLKSLETFTDEALKDVQLYPLFLNGTCDTLSNRVDGTSTHIRALFEAAEKGFAPAQGIVNRVLQSYDIKWPRGHEKHKQQWLFNGAAKGCSVAKGDLLEIDEALAHKADATFREEYGYQQHYTPHEDQAYWRKSVASDNKERPTGKGGPKKVEGLMPLLADSFKQHFEHQSDFQKQKMLYMACLGGNPHVTRQLCRLGVSATLHGDPNGATCLHWLFNFPDEYMKEVAILLINNGANVNARLAERKTGKQWLFPYAMPGGTPVQWAVAASNATSVTVLVDCDANYSVRDGIDPYRYDSNVRYLDREGPGGSYSIPPPPPQNQPEGLSAMDLAVANHDWKMVEALGAAISSKAGIFQVDEEGYSPFHRLEHNWIGHTWSGGRFWYGAFWRSSSERSKNVRRTVEAMQALGGDIDRATRPSEQNLRKGDRPGSLTPLMLAVRKADVAVVDALLSCGADPNIENNLGFNALCLLPADLDPEICPSNVSPVVDSLLRYGARPNVPSPFNDFSPLASAIESGSLAAVASVLQAGADFTGKHKQMGVLAYLMGVWNIELFIRPPQRSREEWEASDEKIAQLIITYVLNENMTQRLQVLNNMDNAGGTLLHYAARSGLLSVVDCLLRAKLDTHKIRQQPPPQDHGIHEMARFLGAGTPVELVNSRHLKLLETSGRHEGFWGPDGELSCLTKACKGQTAKLQFANFDFLW